jgi:hypothetical protein
MTSERYNAPNITIEFTEKYSEKPWDWKKLGNNLFLFHPVLVKKFGKFPEVSKKQRDILNELAHVHDMPPNCSSIPIFGKGGYLYHETWNKINKNRNSESFPKIKIVISSEKKIRIKKQDMR